MLAHDLACFIWAKPHCEDRKRQLKVNECGQTRWCKDQEGARQRVKKQRSKVEQWIKQHIDLFETKRHLIGNHVVVCQLTGVRRHVVRQSIPLQSQHLNHDLSKHSNDREQWSAYRSSDRVLWSESFVALSVKHASCLPSANLTWSVTDNHFTFNYVA